ncbi:MAG: DNA-processing protein DprA, partial [Candidatus Levybacteria bacterium]|nr:DNA-processing protein DprA [Candidatus Levybacteria bacterium]
MEENACLSFSLCKGVGPKTFLKLVRHFGSAQNAWNAFDLESAKEVGIGEKTYLKFDTSRKELDIEDYLLKINRAKVSIIGFTNLLYPQSLKVLESPPIVLFCKGDVELLKHLQNIGIVGARKITSYGKDVTQNLTSDLVANNFCIVSGLAFGVDAIAHKTALEHKGKTIAVLGCGVDCVTPLENERLYEEILDKGGLIVSEYRLGLPPSAGSFPARNRIIAALSLG